jgi:hypothetical protein
MKSSERFKNTIKAHLDKRATEDELFAVTYAKTNKNIDDCITYILNTVQKSGCNGFSDDEIYSMALHYYDEDCIVAGKPINCQVVVNHRVELTAEEKEVAHKEALQKATNEAYNKIKQPQKRVTSNQNTFNNTPSLFNS